MHEELVDVVDAEDRVVDRVPRSQMREQNLRHRSIAILCRNRSGQIYVHKRTAHKDVFPGLYDMFVGGVVAAGEDYAEAARRELAEELGIVGPEPKFMFRHLYEGAHSRAIVAVYAVTWDGPVLHQESEVAWGRFFALEELHEALRNGLAVVPDGADCFAELVTRGLLTTV